MPDLAVGRLDFARLPVFSGLTEVDLIKRYLAKNGRYRMNGLPTFGRVSSLLGDYAQTEGANASQSASGALFGVESGRVFNASGLLDQPPADLAVTYSDGTFNNVNLWASGTPYGSANFADPSAEVPVHFRQVWFSYASDWAWMNELNQNDRTNNWLRASLGWTNYGLATMGGPVWDFAPLGGGAPLAMTMTHGWEGVDGVPRFQSILGDPTLRLHRVTPPSNLKASRSGSTVTLTWSPSAEGTRGYFVYRSTNGLDGFTTPLNTTPVAGLSFTDSTSVTNLLYQVKAAKLQATGSGSYTNLSQGLFLTVP